MKVNTHPCFRIYTENEPGSLAEPSEYLAKEGINVLGYTTGFHQGRPCVWLVPEDPEAAAPVLEHAGLDIQMTDVITSQVPNRPGSLANVTSLLGQAGINIDASFVALDPSEGDPWVVLDVAETDRAQQVLQGAN
ncbi:MAG: ACT domain-containing protein [Candidatus Thermoplasmatota archaeon]|nr:ACT domain-containing protein [Candidatus Thermoplasmatota archaeon]